MSAKLPIKKEPHPQPLPACGYGVHTSRITPLNPPLERGETRESRSLPFTRGGLGWGNSRTGSDSITCVYTVAPLFGRGDKAQLWRGGVLRV